MRKQIIQISLFALAISGLFVACKSDSDTTAPTIELKGRNPDSLEMLVTYVDLGATATDDQDGSLTSDIAVDASAINNKLPGSYEVHYSVSDAAGNYTDVSRTVVVYADANALAKTYLQVKDTCFTGTTPTPNTPYDQTLTKSTDTRVTFNKFANYANNTGIWAEISRTGTITIPYQIANNIGSPTPKNRAFHGTGYVTSTGFYIEYYDVNKSLTPADSVICRAYFTR